MKKIWFYFLIPGSLLLNYSFGTAFDINNRTQVVVFQPFVHFNELKKDLFMVSQYTGKCWTNSLANRSRPEAWRCQSENLILDPCFQSGYGLMACIISPWGRKVTILELKAPLPTVSKKPIDYRGQPWAVELADGHRCTFMTGATLAVRNLRMNYSCDYEYQIVGDIDKTTPIWHAVLHNTLKNSFQTIAVKRAWY